MAIACLLISNEHFIFKKIIPMTTNSKEYARKYYLANREQYRAYSKKHYVTVKREKFLKNPNPRLFDMREDYKATTKKLFKEVPELTYYQQYYAANREKVRAQQKAYRERNKRNEKQRAYYAANRERIRAQQNARRKATKQQEQPYYFVDRIIERFRNLFR